ncbi:Protein CDV3 [Nymphon striatum]|nr:Protein CDV3 [Nymphon striatum]
MADSSLDNFFAKKDKSKKSKTKKFGSNGQSTKTTDDGGKLSEKGSNSKKEKESISNVSSNSLKNNEEWHEYDEKEKDYTGLKIQSLQICEKEKEDFEKDIEGEFNDDGEPIRADGSTGPWKVVKNPAQEVPETKPETEELPKTPNVVGGKYIPPHERSGASRLRVPMKSSRVSRLAPKIDCQSDFPSLSSAVDSKNESNAEHSNFEEVRNRTRIRDENNGKRIGPKLDLGNKYHALGADSI